MNVEETVMKYVGTELAAGKTVDMDTNLVGVVDSTAIMELVVWIESTFGFSVEIDAITPENFGTVRLISNYVKSNMGAKN
jgi:acyl carrier protein